MLLILLCLALPGVNLGGTKPYQTLQPCCVSQKVALSPASPSFLLSLTFGGVEVSAHSSHHNVCKIRQLCGGSKSRHDRNHQEQDLTLGNWGPSAAPASLELSSAGAAGAGKNTRGNYLFDFVFCTNLALKRAQLSLCQHQQVTMSRKTSLCF